MPNDNIDRAVKKGTGELGSQTMEEIIYEGYAPGGVALIVEAATDNKNRTAADMRSIFSKNHGNLGGPEVFHLCSIGKAKLPYRLRPPARIGCSS